MPTSLIVAPPRIAGHGVPSAATTAGGLARGATTALGGQGPLWGLRIEGDRVALVLQNAALPLGGRIAELVVGLPHVGLPFDFSGGLDRFQHHRGVALAATLSLELEPLFERLRERTSGMVTARAVEGSVIFSGHTEEGARFTARGRVVPDLADSDMVDEPTLLLSLFDLRVYGRTDRPWALLARHVLEALRPEWIVERTLTTARLALLRELLSWALSDLGWKLPSLAALRLRSARVEDGRLELRFGGDPNDEWVTLDAATADTGREGLERFIEDLELKQHHGAIDRALSAGQFREAMAEVYRAVEGPLRPGFLAERLIGICAANPVLFDEGDKVCREVLAHSPGYATGLCGLAAIAMGRGLMEEAAVHFERLSTALVASTERQDAIAADLTLAESLRAIDREEARAALERILERAPDHEEALDTLVRMAAESGDRGRTLALSKRLLFAARTPERTRQAGLALARDAVARGEPEEARVYLEVVLEAVPTDLEARMALAEVAEDDEAAMATLEEALRAAHPADAAGVLRVARAVAARALSMQPQQAARARRVLWRTVDNPAVTDADRVELGEMALQADAADLAERYVGRIDRMSTEWPDGRCLQARSRLVRGLREDALDMALSIVETAPGHEGALDLLASTATDSPSRERALLVLGQAAHGAAGTERGRVNATLGQLYEALGLEWDAIAPYRDAAERLDADDDGWVRAASRLLELYPRYGMWVDHQELCEVWLSHRTQPRERVPYLLARGRVALREQDDAVYAAPSLAEAVRLAPRNIQALTLYRDALDKLDRQQELVGVLRRIETVHPDERERVAARIRLAEIELQRLDAPSQARATLSRLPAWAREDARVVALQRQIDTPNAPATPPPMAPEPVATPAAPKRVDPSRTVPQPGYRAAVEAADRGDLSGAQTLLEAWLGEHPLDTAGLELMRIIAVEAGDRATVEEATDALLVLVAGREARATMLAETIALMPATAERYAGILARLQVAPASTQVSAPAAPAQVPDGPMTTLPAPAQQRLDEGDRIEATVAEADKALATGELGRAEQLLSQVLDIDGDHVVALELQAQLQESRGRWRELTETLQRLADLSFDAQQTLAYTLRRAELLADVVGDREAAAEAWSQYVEWQPLDDEVFPRLQRYLEETGDHAQLLQVLEARADAALEELEAELEPLSERLVTGRLVEARHLQAQVQLNALDAAADALNSIDDALALRPGEPELLVTKVRVLAALGQRKPCRDLIDRLLPLLVPGPLKDELQLLRGG